MLRIVIKQGDTGELVMPKALGGTMLAGLANVRVRFKLMDDSRVQLFHPVSKCLMCEGSGWIYHNSAYYPDTACDACYGTGWRIMAVTLGLSDCGIFRCTPAESFYYYYKRD